MGCKPHDPMDVTENAGLYVLAAREIFSKLNGRGKNGKRSNHNPSVDTSNMCLYVSCFEIYGGKLFDLLNDHAAVKCLEDAKQHVQLLGTYVHSFETFLLNSFFSFLNLFFFIFLFSYYLFFFPFFFSFFIYFSHHFNFFGK